ncbi:MAG: 2-amino-4-hydroxy-6-hydroxymethyldihydropteridine diphosphokinase [Planctomycetota bacterium]|nr:2-amino-4-hydroxy-6-hydroxymethyldihydropteridine diphosphokinase [Planctomycetota bacterium]
MNQREPRELVKAYVAFGSNLGDRFSTIKQALTELRGHASILVQRVSSVYETEPVGFLDQGPFLNGVLELDTSLSPRSLLQVLLDIENKLGRVREQDQGPRTIDLDLLFFGDLLLDEENLTLPHPRLHERAFVLRPLLEIAPKLQHPCSGRTIEDLCEETLKGVILRILSGPP